MDPRQDRAEIAAARNTAHAVWAPRAEHVELVLVDTAPGELTRRDRHDAAHADTTLPDTPDQDTADQTTTDQNTTATHEPGLWPVAVRVALRRGPGGWWVPEKTVAELVAEHGLHQDNPGYGYVLDGAGPFPDPRSRRQPDTVHGPSRGDDEHFDWTDADWTGPVGAGQNDVGKQAGADPEAPQGGGLRDAVLYELHVGTFTAEGTLDSAIERLDDLAELGITHVELLPVNSFSGPRNWGYDGVGWYAVDESYGGPQAYRRFVDAAHARGLGVIQDVVYNHLGPDGNYLGQFGPYTGLGQTGWGEALNLDGPDSDEVRAFILGSLAMYIDDLHVDGFRLDAVHALRDTRAVHLLEEMAALADQRSAALGRPLPLMAESDLNDAAMVSPRLGGPGHTGIAGGHGLAGQWNDDVHHVLHVATTGETHGYYADFAPLESLVKVVESGFFHDGTFSSFRGRDHGRPVLAAVPTHAFVTFLQNHDQVGNRAQGDRTAAVLSEGALTAAAALLLTGPWTPMLFMGEEFAASTPFPFFTSFPGEELATAVREGRRREFAAHGWDAADVPDPQDPATRDAAVLDWTEAEHGRGARVRETYRRLIALRRQHAALTCEDRAATTVRVDAAQRLVRWDRAEAAGQPATVTLLAGLGAGTITVPDDLRGARVLAGHTDDGAVTSEGAAPGEDAAPGSFSAPGFLLLGR
ncbi:MAG: malto-oligosyltrehalose trehalohydrolase [Micrococcus sp.]|nr:malto-oligosyltrehalose trehalohydrolase [Micrococcus sp.]